jgi:hypothetical protein
MKVAFSGPKDGKLDMGLQASALMAINHFAKSLGIRRLHTNILVRFHHKLYVDNSQCAEGYCEPLDRRTFILDVALYGNWMSTLAHEMVHVKQFAKDELDMALCYWKGKDHSSTGYWKQPWEVEARKLQIKLMNSFMKEYES